MDTKIKIRPTSICGILVYIYIYINDKRNNNKKKKKEQHKDEI